MTQHRAVDPNHSPTTSEVWITTSDHFAPPQQPQWARPVADQSPKASSARSLEDLRQLRRPPPFEEERRELEDMRQSTKLNKWYEPISRIPKFDGPPNLSKLFGKLPPECAEAVSVPRHYRIIHRWESMPHLRPQLPVEHLHAIKMATSGSTSRGRRGAQESAAQEALRRGRQRRLSGHEVLRREVGLMPMDLSEERDSPFIPCNCCDRKRPKPWLEKRNVGAVAMALVAEALGESPERGDSAAAVAAASTSLTCGSCGRQQRG